MNVNKKQIAGVVMATGSSRPHPLSSFLKNQAPLSVSISSRVSIMRCGYCHDDLGEDYTNCQYCGVVIHHDCWQEHGSCICGAMILRYEPKSRSRVSRILSIIGSWTLSFIITIVIATISHYLL